MRLMDVADEEKERERLEAGEREKKNMEAKEL